MNFLNTDLHVELHLQTTQASYNVYTFHIVCASDWSNLARMQCRCQQLMRPIGAAGIILQPACFYACLMRVQDVMMPQVDGIELLRFVRSNEDLGDMPVISECMIALIVFSFPKSDRVNFFSSGISVPLYQVRITCATMHQNSC